MAFRDGKMTTIGSASMPVSEAQIQAALVNWWQWQCRKYGLPEEALYHAPQEGKRTFMAANNLKRAGWRKGFPDLFLMAPCFGKGGLFIELKSEYGRPTKEQKAFLSLLRAQGYAASVCYGFDAAKTCIEGYLTGKEIPETLK